MSEPVITYPVVTDVSGGADAIKKTVVLSAGGATIYVSELPKSRALTRGASPAREDRYHVSGTDSEQDAADALFAAAPEEITDSKMGALIQSSYTVEEVFIDSGNLARCRWLGTVKYQPFPPYPRTGTTAASFSTKGGTQHVTHSKQTLRSYGRYSSGIVETPPDFKQAVGVDKNGVQGADIIIPVYNYSFTKYIAAAKLTDEYRGRLFYLTGKVNADAFGGTAAGESLFNGVEGSRRAIGDWELRFEFSASPNMQDIYIGDVGRDPNLSHGIVKGGWEYLWVYYSEMEDPTAHCIVNVPTAAYVEKMYDTDTFAKLDPDWTPPGGGA